jgi:hypothetical protein
MPCHVFSIPLVNNYAAILAAPATVAYLSASSAKISFACYSIHSIQLSRLTVLPLPASFSTDPGGALLLFSSILLHHWQ